MSKSLVELKITHTSFYDDGNSTILNVECNFIIWQKFCENLIYDKILLIRYKNKEF